MFSTSIHAGLHQCNLKLPIIIYSVVLTNEKNCSGEIYYKDGGINKPVLEKKCPLKSLELFLCEIGLCIN